MPAVCVVCVLSGPPRMVTARSSSAAVAILGVFELLHSCTFRVNPHFDLEPDYIIRKPIVHRIQLDMLRQHKPPPIRRIRISDFGLLDPKRDLDRHQNCITWSLTPALPSKKFRQNPSTSLRVIRRTDRQIDRQTDRQTDKQTELKT